MSHTHDLSNLEIDITWSDSEGVIAISEDGQEVFVEDGEWYLDMSIGTSCGLYIPMAHVLELLKQAQESPHRHAAHKPEHFGVDGAICCFQDPPTEAAP